MSSVPPCRGARLHIRPNHWGSETLPGNFLHHLMNSHFSSFLKSPFIVPQSLVFPTQGSGTSVLRIKNHIMQGHRSGGHGLGYKTGPPVRPFGDCLAFSDGGAHNPHDPAEIIYLVQFNSWWKSARKGDPDRQ